MEQLAYSPRQACEALGIGRTTLYGLIGQGHLAALSMGGRTLIPAASLRAFLASLPAARVATRPSNNSSRAK